jgi:predicted Holliday junction resolvase-like endonuclease
MTSVKFEVAELRHEVEKLKKRVKRDEKDGLLDGKERTKRAPSKYNEFIDKHIHDLREHQRIILIMR